MAKKNKFDIAEDNKKFTDKKRKSVVLPFILCLIIAVVIWLYASSTNEDQNQNDPAEASLQCHVTEASGEVSC